MGLDEVWWLVSPRNPLKARDSLADYGQRIASAQGVAAHSRRVRVLDFEARHRLRYSWQTVALLKRRYPGVRFVWLMGADNLAGFHRWRRWTQLLDALPIVVFDRAPYSHKALRSKTFLRMRRRIIRHGQLLAGARSGLCFLHLRRDAQSATALRKTLGKLAFLRHTETSKSKRKKAL